MGIQGASNTGKTWAALTFPNPIVVDIDNGLTAHRGRDIISLPFWDDKWVEDYLVSVKLPPRKSQRDPVNKRDALKHWIALEAPKLSPDQTLVVDSWSMLQDCFDRQTDLEPVYSKDGKIDDFAFWALKIDYSRDILTYLNALKCHVVVTFHEQGTRDAKGVLTEKISPLMQGKFVTRLASFFSDFFRQHAREKLLEAVPANATAEQLLSARKTTEYLWQVKSDNLVNCKTRMTTDSMFVPATFDSLKSYVQK